MKKIIIAFVIGTFIVSPAIAQTYPKQNSCVPTCQERCNGRRDFMECYRNCIHTCIPQKTNNTEIDKQNYCEMNCALTGINWTSCMNTCKKNYSK